jgi:xylulokinase
MYLGIDIGTSAVKAVLVDERQEVIAQSSVSLVISRPHKHWSEQNPEDWWQATCAACAKLKQSHRRELAGVAAIGLSGQMHGATLLDKNNGVLRPAILWNDGRSEMQCRELHRRLPGLSDITGNLAMPGFTAPKLMWVAQHEPTIFARVAKVLLPKDYVRFRMTGEFVSDMSDSAGTLWLDVARREWSGSMLEATQMTSEQMPRLVEGCETSAELNADIAQELGLPKNTPVAGGGGDNACGAVGIGAVEPGRAFLSLGTSGVFFVSNAKYLPNPNQAVHAFCHAVPQTWHQMSVILSASSCLSWVCKLTGADDEGSLLDEIEASGDGPAEEIFLPYLSGERTPHNNPRASGVFFGLGHESDRAKLGRAVLDGVAFAFADGQQALINAGAIIDSVSVIGGGARSLFWGRILASVLNRPLNYHSGGRHGPAFGAARLARLSVGGESHKSVCTTPPVAHVVEPDPSLAAQYESQIQAYRNLYLNLENSFSQ